MMREEEESLSRTLGDCGEGVLYFQSLALNRTLAQALALVLLRLVLKCKKKLFVKTAAFYKPLANLQFYNNGCFPANVSRGET